MNKQSEKKRKLLEEFKVPLTLEISNRLEELQDDDVALDQYVHTIIKNHLYQGDI